MDVEDTADVKADAEKPESTLPPSVSLVDSLLGSLGISYPTSPLQSSTHLNQPVGSHSPDVLNSVIVFVADSRAGSVQDIIKGSRVCMI